jgi:hypothetical protein
MDARFRGHDDCRCAITYVGAYKAVISYDKDLTEIPGERLGDHIEGQRDLVALHGKPVIPPGEVKFYPAIESLRWREQHLVTAG